MVPHGITAAWTGDDEPLMRYRDPASAPPTAHERSILGNPPTRHAAGEQPVTDDPWWGEAHRTGRPWWQVPRAQRRSEHISRLAASRWVALSAALRKRSSPAHPATTATTD